MEIKLSPQLPPNLTLTTRTPEIRNWQTGQILQAVARTPSQNGQVTLQLGSQTLEARTPVPLQAGQSLTLEVIQQGQTPLLRILPPSSTNLIDQAMRQALPRQNSLAPLLANLTQLVNSTQREVLPSTLLQAMRSFLKILPEPRQASSAEGLRQAVRNSGIFLESRLRPASAMPTPELQRDLKAGLLRFQQQTQDAYRAFAKSPAGRSAAGQPTTVAPPNPRAGSGPAADATANSSAREGTHPGGTGKLAATVIRDPALPARPEPAARAQEPASTRLQPNPLPASTGSAQPATTTLAGYSLEQLLRSVPYAREHLPPLLRNGSLQAQSRAEASLAQQESLTRIFATLLKETDSSLARMQLTQLGSHASESDQRQIWLLELPIRKEDGIDLFQFRIEREPSTRQEQEQQEGERWTMRFSFALTGLGPIYARVSILDDTVSTTLWIEEEETARLFNRHRETLEQNLLRAGLVIDHFAFIKGTPSEETGFDSPRTEQMLNEQA